MIGELLDDPLIGGLAILVVLTTVALFLWVAEVLRIKIRVYVILLLLYILIAIMVSNGVTSNGGF